MKNFDLNTYGVQELSASEKKEINGGHKVLYASQAKEKFKNRAARGKNLLNRIFGFISLKK